MSVLVVEDEYPIRRGLKAVLERHFPQFGQVVECANESEAWTAFESQTFDLVVSDLNLGQGSGLDLLKRIHQARPATPTIILSGHSEFAWAREAIRYGVRAYLLKPLDLKEFSEVLGTLAPSSLPTQSDEKAKQVIRYLNDHLDEALDMAQVANSVNLSYSYFSEWFRDATGLKFSEYLLRIRLERARILLADPSALVADVAKAVGYPDARTFSKAFHRATGLTPSQGRFNDESSR